MMSLSSVLAHRRWNAVLCSSPHGQRTVRLSSAIKLPDLLSSIEIGCAQGKAVLQRKGKI